MKNIHLIFLIASLLFSFHSFAEKPKKAKGEPSPETLVNALRAASSGPKVTQECISCLAPEKRPKATIDSKSNKQNFQVSIITESEAMAFFQEFKNDKSIPFEFPFDGCYARAHTMCQRLEKKGIIAGKGWVEGELQVTSPEFGPIRWNYHVAPMVMVRVNGKDVPYILDPSIMDKPVPFEEWKKKMTTNKGTKATAEYFTPRYHYGPYEKTEQKTDYDEESNEDASDSNDKFIQMLQFYRDQLKKSGNQFKK